MSGPGRGWGRFQKNIWRYKGHGFFKSIEDIHARIMKQLTLKWINKEASKQISKTNFSHLGIIAWPLKTTAKKIFRATRIKDGPSFSESAIWHVSGGLCVHTPLWGMHPERNCHVLAYTRLLLCWLMPRSLYSQQQNTDLPLGMTVQAITFSHCSSKLHQILESSIFFPPPYNDFFTQKQMK